MQKHLSSAIIALLITTSAFSQNDTKATEQWRPVYHFTPLKNWTNDPNGLIYFNGQYQLYYQHNPFANEWGHMSWGHAGTTDFIHWKHYPVAIPEKIDKDTTWIFSGSAVYDKNNTSGFCKNGGCLVAIYTAHQPNLHKESQFIAYSNDGGMSYTNYEKNPVIDLQKTDFRDPNVQWDEANKRWRMVVAVPAEHKVRFYGSPNLKDWKLLSEFGGEQGYHQAAWECPSLVQLPVDGNPVQKKWVLFVSSGGPEGGPSIQYFTGEFDGTTFKNDRAAGDYLMVDNGNTFYAAIPYNDAPDKKEILLGWMVPLETATYPWRGQMSIPRDLSLKTTAGGVKLYQQPSSVIASSLAKLPAGRQMSKANLVISDTSVVLNSPQSFNTNTNWIEATFTPATAADFGFKVAQSIDDDGVAQAETVINYHIATNELSIANKKDTGALQTVRKVMVKPADGKLKLTILLDRSSLEVFANDGEKVLTTYIFPAEHATQFSAFAKGGKTTIDTLKVYDLKE